MPILYEVDRIRDGTSFTTRRVVAIQHGKAIFNLAASFQVDEPGLEHQIEMPEVPGPEGLENEVELRQKQAHRLPETLAARSFLRDAPDRGAADRSDRRVRAREAPAVPERAGSARSIACPTT